MSELKRYVANHNKTLGPIIMATSAMIGIHPRFHNQTEQILEKQRKLSEVADMIHAAHVFHRCVREIPPQDQTQDNNDNQTNGKSLHQDNVMSLLLGDYLLAQSSVDMAELRLPKTVGLIAKALENYTRGEFLKYKMLQQNMLGTTQKMVETYAELTCGSLLSHACLSATLIAGYNNQDQHGRHLLEATRELGLHIGTAQRLLDLFYSPETINEDELRIIENLDISYYRRSILVHLESSLNVLQTMADNESRSSLVKLIEKMQPKD